MPSSDPPTNPGVPRAVPASDSADQDAHVRVGLDIRLPVPVDIIDRDHATRAGFWVNQLWLDANSIAIGLFGTGASWFVACASLAAQHPRTAVACLAILSVLTEEKFSDQPIFTNLLRYGMESYDEDAAAKIFAERPVDPDPIGTAAKKAVEEATATFLESADYRLFKDEIEMDVNRQTRRQGYIAAGMTAEVEAIDEEITAAREQRRAERERAKEAEHPQEEPASSTHGSTSIGRQPDGRSLPAVDEEAEPLEASTDPGVEEAPATEAHEAKTGKTGKADRRSKAQTAIESGQEILQMMRPDETEKKNTREPE